MPKEPRRVPTVLGRVHRRTPARPSGSVLFSHRSYFYCAALLTPAKKKNAEWWCLGAALAALALALVLHYLGLQGNAIKFLEGLCLGLSIAFLIAGLIKIRRDSGRA
jgi:hypothetical protein